MFWWSGAASIRGHSRFSGQIYMDRRRSKDLLKSTECHFRGNDWVRDGSQRFAEFALLRARVGRL
jgi:hypothetical protein